MTVKMKKYAFHVFVEEKVVLMERNFVICGINFESK
jgi:hypothetical protein